jgi:Protein of unknown function (DUF2778)
VRGAKLTRNIHVGSGHGNLISPEPGAISVIAVLAVGVALGLPAVRKAVSGSETLQPKNFDLWDSKNRGRASSAEDISIDPGLSPFDERFVGALDCPNRRQPAETKEQAGNIFLRSPDWGGRAASQHVVSQSARPLPGPPPANVANKQLRVAAVVDEDSISSFDAGGHAAIYDIAARTVYLANGRELEAHSGLGRYLDDQRYVTDKDRGPTSPNRLIPVGGGNMFGRDGMLAHSYMLGFNGQSNGCVSFSDYSAFLDVSLSGDINHLVVVEHLATTPTARTTFGQLPEITKAPFERS